MIAEEGDSNRSPRRAGWQAALDGPTRDLVRRDAEAFLHQTLSSWQRDAKLQIENLGPSPDFSD